MKRISSKIKQVKRIPISKSIYEPFYYNSLIIEFACPNCQEEFSFDLLENYQPLRNFVIKEGVSDDLILKNGMAQLGKTYRINLDSFYVFGILTANFIVFDCPNCNSHFIEVFGFGESQPARDVLYISGVWEIIR